MPTPPLEPRRAPCAEHPLPTGIPTPRLHLRRLARPGTARDAAAAWLERLSAPAAMAISLGLLLVVAVGDAMTGADVSFTLLYLGPIGFATWFVTLPAGFFVSAVAAASSLGADVASRTFSLPVPVVAWNVGVQLGVFVALAVLLSALKDRLEAEAQLARTDPLTRVSNRRAFLESASLELARARRSGRPFTVAYLDCDDFKAVNDEFGHAQGDALLALAAATLRSATRAIDSVARLGGDEFGLLLVDTDVAAAEALLGRLRGELATAMRAHGWRVSFSIGAVTFAAPPRSLDEMLGRADGLMYEAKRSGKDALRLEVAGAGPQPVADAPATPAPDRARANA